MNTKGNYKEKQQLIIILITTLIVILLIYKGQNISRLMIELTISDKLIT